MTPWDLRTAYEEGENILQLLALGDSGSDMRAEHVELSYDLQAGEYARAFDACVEIRERKHAFGKALLEVFQGLCGVQSILDAGVGEGTTLWSIFSQMSEPHPLIHAVDLCWSRVAVCKHWLARQRPRVHVALACASLTELPYANDSFDVVYTTHSLEPNRGLEPCILSELYRVASRYAVLVEPAYELVSEDRRRRMDRHGYCRGLLDEARKLGMNVVRHELFMSDASSRNPSALLIIEKDPRALATSPTYACPAYRTPLEVRQGCYYSSRSCRVYPLVGGIPCLRSSHAILASRFTEYSE